MAKTYRQLCEEHADDIGKIRVMLKSINHVSPITQAKIINIDAMLRRVQRHMEAGADTPKNVRTKRIAAEVALTGLEQELDL